VSVRLGLGNDERMEEKLRSNSGDIVERFRPAL